MNGGTTRTGLFQTRELTSREWSELFKKVQQERDEARAEVARLREALAELAKPVKPSFHTVAELDAAVCRIARKALEETE